MDTISSILNGAGVDSFYKSGTEVALRDVSRGQLRKLIDLLPRGSGLKHQLLRVLMSINIDGDSVSSITIDGDQVQEVTVDGDVVFSATETVAWGTASDWDNSVSESGVAHESTSNTDQDDSTTVNMGYSPGSPYKSSSLAGYLPFQEDSGSTAYDFSGNGNHGSISGATVGKTGLLGTTCYRFDGGDDYVQSDGIAGSMNASEGTVCCWINYESTVATDQWICAIGDQYNERIDFAFNNTNFISSSNSHLTFNYEESDVSHKLEYDVSGWSTGEWHFVAMTWSSSNNAIRIYTDGVERDSISFPSSSSFSNKLWIGASQNGSGLEFNGKIADFRAYTTELSSSEIQTLYDVVYSQGALTTSSKSFSTSRKPDLTDLSYSLNGQSITVDVIGSPGTASEEVVSQTLGGSSSYSLSWSNSHSDFRIKPRLSTGNKSSTPTFNSGSLKG